MLWVPKTEYLLSQFPATVGGCCVQHLRAPRFEYERRRIPPDLRTGVRCSETLENGTGERSVICEHHDCCSSRGSQSCSLGLGKLLDRASHKVQPRPLDLQLRARAVQSFACRRAGGFTGQDVGSGITDHQRTAERRTSAKPHPALIAWRSSTFDPA